MESHETRPSFLYWTVVFNRRTYFWIKDVTQRMNVPHVFTIRPQIRITRYAVM